MNAAVPPHTSFIAGLRDNPSHCRKDYLLETIPQMNTQARDPSALIESGSIAALDTGGGEARPPILEACVLAES